jgi:hypothetical protein
MSAAARGAVMGERDERAALLAAAALVTAAVGVVLLTRC